MQKVKDCLKRLLPEDFDEKEIQIDNLAGSYGNPIRALIIKMTTQSQIREFIANLTQILGSEVKETLNREVETRLDEKHKFFFRIAKQSLALGAIELAYDSDVIRITLAVYCKNPKISITTEDIRVYFQNLQIL